MKFKIKTLNTGLHNHFDYEALLRNQAQSGQGTATVIATDGKSKQNKKGSYYPSKVTGPETIKAGEEAVYKVTDFSLFRGSAENEEDKEKDKTKIKWILHIPDIQLKNNLLNYIQLTNGIGGQAKIQAESETDFMDITDPKKRTEAIMKHGITYIKIEGDKTNHTTKLTLKLSKWLDGYKIYIEAYRRKPDIKKQASGSTVATTIKAEPEIIEGYWMNDKKENITNKIIGYKDTVYMCLKTLGMKNRNVTTQLWEEGVTYMGTYQGNDETLCMDENILWKLDGRYSYKKLTIPDMNTEEYKKQREGIFETDPLDLFFSLPKEKQTKGYIPKYGKLLYLTTNERVSAAYFAQEIKEEAIKDGTVQEEQKQPATSNSKTKLPKKITTYKQITEGDIGGEVWLVVETANLHGKTVAIEVFDSEKLLAENDETPIKLLQEDKEVTKLKNIKIDTNGKAKVKIKIRPKNDDDLKKIKEKLKSDKVAKLYVKVTCTGDNKTHTGTFLNENYFELKNGCGVKITPEILKKIFPKSNSTRRKEVAEAINKYKCEFEINNLDRMAHFLGQIGTETNQLNALEENPNYSAKTIYNIFLRKVLVSHPTKSGKKTFKYHDLIEGYNATLECEYSNPTGWSQSNYGHKRDVDNSIEVPTEIVNNKIRASWSYSKFNETYSIKEEYIKNKKLFDYVYGCRMGNGKRSTEDGSDYFGVGFIHLTGKDKYKALHKKWNELYPDDKKDFMGDDISLLKTNVDVAMKASMIIWTYVQKGTNKKADKGNNNSAITAVTKDVNGGDNGLAQRKKFTKKAYKILKDKNEK